MRKTVFFCCAIPATLVIGDFGFSRGGGFLPAPNLSLTRVSSASCGGFGVGCHRVGPFLTDVSVAVGQRVLGRNASTQITVTGKNTGVAGTRGGFTADVTLGTLVAGTNTRISATGNAITHQNAFSTGRSWKFSFKAGTRPGLAEFYTVVNAVNGNGRADGGDEWALNSDKKLASQTTPVRLFVNADGVKSTGPGCDDGFGNYSVLGAPTSPTVGNAGFSLEAHGLPPAARFLLMLNVGGNVPGFDMAPLGAPGCVLRTTLQAQVGGVTSGGDALRGEGRVILPAPIPNDALLKGVVLSIQIGALDSKPKRSFPMVVTNAIEVTIQ